MAKNETAAKTQAEAPAKTVATYTKEQLAGSSRYATRRDLVSVLLEDGKAYTLAEVDELINKFMKGAVK